MDIGLLCPTNPVPHSSHSALFSAYQHAVLLLLLLLLLLLVVLLVVVLVLCWSITQ